MPFLTPLLQEWKELTAKPIARDRQHYIKPRQATPQLTLELQQGSFPHPLQSTAYARGRAKSRALGRAPCAAPSPGAARVAGRSDTPAPGAPARVLRADPASRRTGSPPAHTARPGEAAPSPRAARLNRLKMNSPTVSSRFSAFKL